MYKIVYYKRFYIDSYWLIEWLYISNGRSLFVSNSHCVRATKRARNIRRNTLTRREEASYARKKWEGKNVWELTALWRKCYM